MKAQFIDAVRTDATHVDVNFLADIQMQKPSINEAVITAFNTSRDGKFSGRHLLSMCTGMASPDIEHISALEHTWYLEEYKRIQSVPITRPTIGNGAGFSVVELTLAENYFSRGDILMLPDETQVRVEELPTRVGDHYCYKVIKMGSNPSPIASRALEPGQLVGWLGNSFGEGSEGGSMKTSTPIGLRNQMTISRVGFNMTGSAHSTALMLEYTAVDGRKFNFWTPRAHYECLQQFFDINEQMLMFGKSNKLENREIVHWEANGKPLTMGSGLEEQISGVNDFYVDNITEELLQYFLLDIRTKAGNPDNLDLMVFTGKGGIKAFHDAMKKASIDLGPYIKEGYFINGSNRKLEYGSQFIKYVGLMGTSFTICHCPLFDDDTLFTDKDPVTGYTMKSYDMWFLNFGKTANGTKNIQVKAKKEPNGGSRFMLQWVVEGSTKAFENSGGGTSIKEATKMASSRATGYDGFGYNALTDRMLIVTDPRTCGRILRNRNWA